MKSMTNDVRDTSSRSVWEGKQDVVGVLTIDDQAVFRRVAEDVIAATPGFEFVGEAECGEDGIAAVERLRPQLVLLDVRMPGIGGIEAARRITTAHPGTVVVLVSIADPDEVSHAARGSGAAALVRKQDFGPALLRSLWTMHGDRR
jgi:two-component system, NarL family, invasion response regulator UvrY